MEKTMSTMRAPNKNGPRKLKSYPLLAAQKVYTVRESTTTVVKIADSRITFPVPTQKHTLYVMQNRINVIEQQRE